MNEIFLGVYQPKGDGGEIIIRRCPVDEAGIHDAVDFMRLLTPGFEWSEVAPAIAAHGFVVEPQTNHPVGHGESFFFGFKLLRVTSCPRDSRDFA